MAEPAPKAAATGLEPPEPAPPDPSMEDILASIRRILNDGEGGTAPGEDEAPPLHANAQDQDQQRDQDQAATGDNDDVFLLEPSMMIDDAKPHATDHAMDPHDEPAEPAYQPHSSFEDLKVTPEPWDGLPEAESSPLMAPEALNAASGSLGLLRGLQPRGMPINRGGAGLTLEDIVRDEIRPLLKAWLDEQLPPLVERLVRAEIQRVTGSP